MPQMVFQRVQYMKFQGYKYNINSGKLNVETLAPS